MGQQYTQLTYAADVTGSEQAQPGHLLGCDEMGRFYEVIDAELCHETHFGTYRADRPHTHVNLQYATPETMRRAARKDRN